ncbi:phosphotyrosine protein phosphatase [Candidatus Woesearchaeota archaeon]|nr:phosphotyrosine protein phosphatase [Candidatus Woesearchaeota archaeon]
MKVLFICNQNQNRSKTAEELFKGRFKTKSAGLFNEKPVTARQLSWADIIIVMEDFQREEIAKRFPEQYIQKKIISLGIRDVYGYNQPELISLLKSKINGLA